MQANKFYLVLGFLREGLNPTKIAKHLTQTTGQTWSKQRVSYYVKYAKRMGFINKTGYATWTVNEEQIKNLKPIDLVSLPKTIKNSNPKKGLPKRFALNVLRGHCFEFKVFLPERQNWSSFVSSKLAVSDEVEEVKPVNFGCFSFLWKKTGYRVHLNPKSLLVWLNKSYFHGDGWLIQRCSIQDLKEFVGLLEGFLGVKIVRGGVLHFKVSRAHFAFVRDALAKEFNDHKEKFFCRDATGEIWLVIDFSHAENELESISSKSVLGGVATQGLLDSDWVGELKKVLNAGRGNYDFIDFISSLKGKPFKAEEVIELRGGIRALNESVNSLIFESEQLVAWLKQLKESGKLGGG